MKKYVYSICSVLCITILTLCCGVIQKPLYAQNIETVLAETAKSALIMDYNSGEVIYEKNAEARLPVASMVKLMTILLTYEEIDKGNLTLDTKIQTTENASKMGGSQVFIDPYVSYKADDLIKSVIMASANDASVALAEHISGSEEVFVEKMNKRANELGLTNTLYANCTGLPAPEQYSCAIDSAKLLKQLLSHKEYHSHSAIWMDKLIHPSGRQTELVNTNKLVRYYKGCDSGKTGSTNEAGYCLTASAIKNDMRLISVVIGAKTGQDRFKEVSSLFNYGFANFSNQLIVDKTIKLDTITITQSKIKTCDIFAKEDFYALCKKGEKNSYETNIVLNENLKAPISCDETIGKIIVTKNGKVIKEIDISTNQNIEKISYFDGIKKIASNW